MAMLTPRNVDFSLAMHALSLFYPASLVVAQALAANAFQTSFATLDEVANQPQFNKHTKYNQLICYHAIFLQQMYHRRMI